MKIIRFRDANEYYQRVENYLLQNEAAHCLLIGLSKALCSSLSKYEHFPYLAIAEREGKIIATAIRTSPQRKLVLSKSTDLEAMKLIAEDAVTFSDRSLPGTIGLKSEALVFARQWQLLTGQSPDLDFAMKIHQLEAVQSIGTAAGNLRLVDEGDRSLLVKWIEAFEDEALGDKEPKSDADMWFEKNLSKKSLYIWQDEIPVSMTGFGGATPNGVKIAPVYTPPEYRGKGYATSCVAAVSQHLLNKGYKYCFLFTDMANHTSNHIYQKIGYQSICEISNYGFKLVD